MREVVAKFVTEANEILAELVTRKDAYTCLVDLVIEMRDSLEKWLKVIDEDNDA